MLRRSLMSSLFTLALLAAGCSQPSATPVIDSSLTVPDSVSPSAETPTTPNPSPLVGGYTETAIDNPEVVAAAAFAVEEQSKSGSSLTLKLVTSAQTQVVAGLNYKLTLSVDEAGATKIAEAVVYQNLQGEKSLTTWEWK